jgi:hypothetical protein
MLPADLRYYCTTDSGKAQYQFSAAMPSSALSKETRTTGRSRNNLAAPSVHSVDLPATLPASFRLRRSAKRSL